MSALNDKSNISILLAVVISSSGFLLGNTDDAITQDAVTAIKNDITDIESEIKALREILSNHKEVAAHQGQAKETEFMKRLLDKLDDRVRNIELFGTKKLN